MLFLLLLLLSGSAWAGDWDGITARLSEQGLPKDKVKALFQRSDLRFDHRPMQIKMKSLFKTRYLTPPEEKIIPESRVYKGYLTKEVISQARLFMRQNRSWLAKAEKDFGASREVVVAIMTVETRLGRDLGGGSALITLASMAACQDFERIRPHLAGLNPTPEQLDWLKKRTREKADWAFDELKALLEYAWAKGRDPLVVPGSVFGAIGICQFMPSNARLHGRDADGDGQVDLFTVPDAILSTGAFLSAAGWRANLKKPARRRVIYQYNQSDVYVNTVLALADRLKTRPPAKKVVKAKART